MRGVSFIGMMIGGLLWGNLADKMGRRRTLLSALLTNAVGGSIPIVFTYYAEFLLKKHRGRNLCWLLLFWAIGGVFASVMAWGLIPRTDKPVTKGNTRETFSDGFASPDVMPRGRRDPLGPTKATRVSLISQLVSLAQPHCIMYPVFVPMDLRGDASISARTIAGANLLGLGRLHFSSWRVFLLICSFPAIVSVLGLAFLPESPRFLLEMGRDVEAMCVYQQIFKMNHSNKPGVEYQFWSSFFQMICTPFTKVTLVLLVIWLTTSFGFYGVSIWFPEYLRKLQSDSYSSEATIEANHFIRDYIFNYSLDNTNFEGCVFHNVRFTGIVLNHVLFTNCSFINSTFSDVRSSRSFFEQCDFRRVRFVDTDFYDFRFRDCAFHNSTTFLNRRTGCPIDFDVNFRLSDVFVENLFVQLAIIPGNIISSCVIDRIGRVRTLGMVHHALSKTCQPRPVSILLVWLSVARSSVITFQAIFNFVSISAWNAVDVATTESYPATLRSTAYGFLSAASRLAALLGSLTFGHFISMNRSVPILTTAAVLLVGCLASLRLPETRDVLM
ncbi:hypothetical protein HPB49_000746 [Dermacentor silvarum]|uniref:Uncharacterized protein n=1 Tax=Dermacentor silvarum TaxID=543639 RepID=A0ACB8CIZ2_DERSI|nr:hypothetical protein HPB49_000746 [Dermacentor silvarum]